MNNKRLSGSAGFTIIETLIVLAIAGLILLIVFLAIPSLQRNSRNNQRKQEVEKILQAVSSFELNHSGQFPGPCGSGTDPLCNASNGPLEHTELNFYDQNASGNVVIEPQDAKVTVSNPNDVNKLVIYNHQKCSNASDGSATWQGAGYNDVVALYALETSSGTAQQCQDL